ncbi:hypothetical protein RRF57_005431 [Xylaria bambusicola]|uniref:Uncharacterized protein n=1 Tax=Xylaria bambusicola TaxID=326684 RepID=A0AAN7UNK3_9PEZI
MLQHMQAYHESRTWFEQALTVCDRVIGPQSLQAASLLFQLAQALALDNESKAALSKMRDCYNIFREELGPENSNTKEAETWLDQLTQNAVAIAKRDKIRAGIFPTRTLGNATSASTASRGLNGGQTSVKQDDRSLDELIGWIEGSSAQKKTTKKRPGRVAPKTRVGAGASK